MKYKIPLSKIVRQPLSVMLLGSLCCAATPALGAVISVGDIDKPSCAAKGVVPEIIDMTPLMTISSENTLKYAPKLTLNCVLDPTAFSFETDHKAVTVSLYKDDETYEDKDPSTHFLNINAPKGINGSRVNITASATVNGVNLQQSMAVDYITPLTKVKTISDGLEQIAADKEVGLYQATFSQYAQIRRDLKINSGEVLVLPPLAGNTSLFVAKVLDSKISKIEQLEHPGQHNEEYIPTTYNPAHYETLLQQIPCGEVIEGCVDTTSELKVDIYPRNVIIDSAGNQSDVKVRLVLNKPIDPALMRITLDQPELLDFAWQGDGDNDSKTDVIQFSAKGKYGSVLVKLKLLDPDGGPSVVEHLMVNIVDKSAEAPVDIVNYGLESMVTSLDGTRFTAQFAANLPGVSNIKVGDIVVVPAKNEQLPGMIAKAVSVKTVLIEPLQHSNIEHLVDLQEPGYDARHIIAELKILPLTSAFKNAHFRSAPMIQTIEAGEDEFHDFVTEPQKQGALNNKLDSEDNLVASIGGFKCDAAPPPGISISGFGINRDLFKVTPDIDYQIIDGKLESFHLIVDLESKLRITTPTVQMIAGLGFGIECSKVLTSVTLPVGAVVGPVIFMPQINPTLAFKLTAAINAFEIKAKGPDYLITGGGRAGFRWNRVEGTTMIHHADPVVGSWDKKSAELRGRPGTDASTNFALEAMIKANVGVGMRTGIWLLGGLNGLFEVAGGVVGNYSVPHKHFFDRFDNEYGNTKWDVARKVAISTEPELDFGYLGDIFFNGWNPSFSPFELLSISEPMANSADDTEMMLSATKVNAGESIEFKMETKEIQSNVLNRLFYQNSKVEFYKRKKAEPGEPDNSWELFHQGFNGDGLLTPLTVTTDQVFDPGTWEVVGYVWEIISDRGWHKTPVVEVEVQPLGLQVTPTELEVTLGLYQGKRFNIVVHNTDQINHTYKLKSYDPDPDTGINDWMTFDWEGRDNVLEPFALNGIENNHGLNLGCAGLQGDYSGDGEVIDATDGTTTLIHVTLHCRDFVVTPTSINLTMNQGDLPETIGFTVTNPTDYPMEYGVAYLREDGTPQPWFNWTSSNGSTSGLIAPGETISFNADVDCPVPGFYLNYGGVYIGKSANNQIVETEMIDINKQCVAVPLVVEPLFISATQLMGANAPMSFTVTNPRETATSFFARYTDDVFFGMPYWHRARVIEAGEQVSVDFAPKCIVEGTTYATVTVEAGNQNVEVMFALTCVRMQIDMSNIEDVVHHYQNADLSWPVTTATFTISNPSQFDRTIFIDGHYIPISPAGGQIIPAGTSVDFEVTWDCATGIFGNVVNSITMDIGSLPGLQQKTLEFYCHTYQAP